MTDTLDWLPERGAPQQLVLLLHGRGGCAAAMAPLAQALRQAFPQAALVARDAPQRVGGGSATADVAAHVTGPAAGAFQWFPVPDTDGPDAPAAPAAPTTSEAAPVAQADAASRAARVEAAVAELLPWVRAQQRRLGVGAPATCLAGFAQGAELAIAAVQAHDGLAGRVLAFAGRYPVLPDVAPQLSTLHFLHGGADPVVPARHARDAIERLGRLGGDATMDIAEGVGHALHPALVECAIERLQGHVPLRTWREAMGAAPARGALP